ncbi:MAG: hypothetical protein IJ668_07230 [Selenomonadaceae bacterium]|nr:hypothetical protein [Selenomonadaceae bacterium]
MKPNVMNNQPIENVEQPVEGSKLITVTEKELEDFTKVPGVDTVIITPQQWHYFVEELKTKSPLDALRRAKILTKITNPPREFETPQYPYVPCGDKSPGIDTVDLTPEEWNYFVEEIKTKSPFKAFNNAKYLVELDESEADIRAGNAIVVSDAEMEALINGEYHLLTRTKSKMIP